MKEGRINANREAIIKILDRKFGLKSLELQNLVKDINNETVLSYLIEEIPFARNVKAAKKIIDTAMKSVL